MMNLQTSHFQLIVAVFNRNHLPFHSHLIKNLDEIKVCINLFVLYKIVKPGLGKTYML